MLLTLLGALSSSAIERVIIDASHIDQKKRGIFDIKETLGPLMLLLNRPELHIHEADGNLKTQLMLY